METAVTLVNIFRLSGGLFHLVAIVILLLKIWKMRSGAGISGKSPLLFALPGSFCFTHFTLQYIYEAHLHWLLLCHGVPDLHEI